MGKRKKKKEDKWICQHCAEVFKNEIDFEAHQFNNKHCPSDKYPNEVKPTN